MPYLPQLSLQSTLLVGALILLPVLGWYFWPSLESADQIPFGNDGEVSDRSAFPSETSYAEDEEAVFECLVVLRDQVGVDPEQGTYESLKRGDVISVRKSPQEWSTTERSSYLLVKMKLYGREASALLEPLTQDGRQIRARKLKVDLDQVGFKEVNTGASQPFEKKIFSKEIVVEKHF